MVREAGVDVGGWADDGLWAQADAAVHLLAGLRLHAGVHLQAGSRFGCGWGGGHEQRIQHSHAFPSTLMLPRQHGGMHLGLPPLLRLHVCNACRLLRWHEFIIHLRSDYIGSALPWSVHALVLGRHCRWRAMAAACLSPTQHMQDSGGEPANRYTSFSSPIHTFRYLRMHE